MSRYLLDTAPLASYLFSRRGAMSLIGPWLRQREVVTSILCWVSRNPDDAEYSVLGYRTEQNTGEMR